MRTLLLLLPLLVTACAATTRPPAPSLPDAFHTGRDPRFPPDRYLVGVGEGPSLEAARRQATASIAAQLQASLRSTDLFFATSNGSGGGEELLQQDIRVESRFDRPEWIRLVDARIQGGRVHVLSVLDRVQAAALLEAEQEMRRTALRLRLEAAAEAADLRGRSDVLDEAGRIARTLLPAEATLAALRGSPGLPPPELQLVAHARQGLERERRAVAVRVCVEPAVATGLASDLASRFGAILAGAGVQVAACEADAAGWTLRGRLVAEVSATRPQPGAFDRYCTVRLDFRLDGPRGLLHGGSAGGRPNRTGGHDFHDACQTSAAAVARQLAVEVGLRDPPGR